MERTMRSRRQPQCFRRTLLRACHSNRSSTICNLKAASFSGPSSYWDREFHLRNYSCACSPGGSTVEKSRRRSCCCHGRSPHFSLSSNSPQIFALQPKTARLRPLLPHPMSHNQFSGGRWIDRLKPAPCNPERSLAAKSLSAARPPGSPCRRIVRVGIYASSTAIRTHDILRKRRSHGGAVGLHYLNRIVTLSGGSHDVPPLFAFLAGRLCCRRSRSSFRG